MNLPSCASANYLVEIVGCHDIQAGKLSRGLAGLERGYLLKEHLEHKKMAVTTQETIAV